MDRYSFITDVEAALHEYACVPQVGLEHFQTLLISFQIEAQLDASDDIFQSRLTSLIAAVDDLLLSGSPYSSDYHVAFLSAADALFQVFVGHQFGPDRVLQLSPLLSLDRPVWAFLCSPSSDGKADPTYSDYSAVLNSEIPKSLVGESLASLASVGQVSFDVSSSNRELLKGRFALTSAQSLSWLKSRFPDFQWELVSKSYDENALRDLCEESFLPIFQHSTMPSDERRRFLDVYEKQLTQLFYRAFGSLFTSKIMDIKQASRMVPIVNRMDARLCEDVEKGDVALPIRHGGVFYTAVDRCDRAFSLSCLGRDYLPSFLYEIETVKGRFVFDQAETTGLFSVAIDKLKRVGDTAYFEFDEGVKSQFQFNLFGYDSIEVFFASSSHQEIDVLVVDQAGQCFALPYHKVREVEGVCSLFNDQKSWAKNVWLDRDGLPYIEPWLIDTRRFSYSSSLITNSLFKPEPKDGYYVGYALAKYYVIEAGLVSALGSYRAPFSYSDLESESSTSFVVQGWRCLERVVTADLVGDFSLDRTERYVFSAILDWMGEMAVLPLELCQWSETLPDMNDLNKMFSGGQKNFIASTQDDVVIIDKTNFLSFIGGLWPSSLPLKSDC
ncbi:MAG: hypothetical protein ABJN96_07215 [Marinomonas sp.]